LIGDCNETRRTSNNPSRSTTQRFHVDWEPLKWFTVPVMKLTRYIQKRVILP